MEVDWRLAIQTICENYGYNVKPFLAAIAFGKGEKQNVVFRLNIDEFLAPIQEI